VVVNTEELVLALLALRKEVVVVDVVVVLDEDVVNEDVAGAVVPASGRLVTTGG
jgi:hypothetical protein